MFKDIFIVNGVYGIGNFILNEVDVGKFFIRLSTLLDLNVDVCVLMVNFM